MARQGGVSQSQAAQWDCAHVWLALYVACLVSDAPGVAPGVSDSVQSDAREGCMMG